MVLPVYAEPADLKKFLGVDELDAEAREVKAALRRASHEVRQHIRAAIYDTDPTTGLPTDANVLEALKEATCAYAAYWDETGDITGAGAVAGSMSILSVSLGGTATGGASSRSTADVRRSDEAITILRNAGLIAAAVVHT
jgi:hypothetical protein